jgi:hypothetical protein
MSAKGHETGVLALGEQAGTTPIVAQFSGVASRGVSKPPPKLPVAMREVELELGSRPDRLSGGRAGRSTWSGG